MANPDKRADHDARTDREVYVECRDRLREAESADNDNRRRAKDDILFREGDQWIRAGAVAPSSTQDKPELVINFTDALCQRIENNIRDECPRGGAHPIGDGADVDIAKVIEGIGRHVEVRSSAAEVAYVQAARNAINGGEGYFRLLSEWEHERSFRRELRIVAIRNSFTVYFDPSSIMPAGEDANWVIITSKMRRPEYKARYPKAKNVDWSGDSRDRLDSVWENRSHIRLAEYFRITERRDKLVLFQHSSGETRTFFRGEVPARLGDFKEIAERDALRKVVEWYRLNGTEVIEKATLPGCWIPVFRVEGNRTDVDGQVIKRGAVRFQRDPQRMMNFGETAKIMRLGLAPKAPWVMAEGQDEGHPEWTDANQRSYSVLKYKPITISTAQGDVMVPPPQRQEPAAIEQGFSEMVSGMRSNLLMVAGMPNDPGQDARGEVVSGKALQGRQKIQDKSHLQYSSNLRLAIAQCWRVMLEWIPATYKEPGRVQRVIGEDSVPKSVKLNEQSQDDAAIASVKNDVTVGRYDVAMDAGPSYQTRREEGAEALLELLSSPPLAQLIAQHGADLVFRSLDHPYMQELADRLQALTPEGLKTLMEQLPPRARSVVQALMQQVQQLQQQLQKVEQDNKAGITKAHLAATVKAHDVEESNATKRADTESRERTEIQRALIERHTKLDVAEIGAGASLLNTHTEARYHREEAERLIQAGEKAENTQ